MNKIILSLTMAMCCTLNAKAQVAIFQQGNATNIGNNFQPAFIYNKDKDAFLLAQKDIATIDSVAVNASFTMPNKLEYRNNYTPEEIEKAYSSLGNMPERALTGQFCLRGGKESSITSHMYEYQFTFGADQYAQYGVIPHQEFPYIGVNISSTYDVDNKFYGGAMQSFNLINNSIAPLINNAAIDTIPELKAIYMLLYDYAAIEVSDIYGPFTYNESKLYYYDPCTYDNLPTIYTTVVEDIDKITECLKHLKNKPEEYKGVLIDILANHSKFLFMPSQVENIDNLADCWCRLANSLKLRMAMRIVKVEPATAKKWAEEAVASGVIEEESQEAAFRPFDIGFSNPLCEISKTWCDCSMSASMESLLKSLNHPYAQIDESKGISEGYLFSKNSVEIVNHKTGVVTPANSRIVGIRSGTHVGEEQCYPQNPYNAFSVINQNIFCVAPLYLMKLSEVCFLRAEGAIRGWNMGGTAQHFYELGIMKAGFEERRHKSKTYAGKNQYDALVNEYMQLEHALPYTYVDPTGDTEDIESVTKIGVKWNESDDLETKLEKIITQKYIAGFPYSFEAWADLRRTGYPKLFEVLNASEGDESLKQGDIIRRLYFPNRTNTQVKKDIEATGLNALGGSDQLGTRLWWDVDKPNF